MTISHPQTYQDSQNPSNTFTIWRTLDGRANHRLDGPAYIRNDRLEYWINNTFYTPDEYLDYIKKFYPRFYDKVYYDMIGQFTIKSFPKSHGAINNHEYYTLWKTVDGNLHRENGPAIEFWIGPTKNVYYKNGEMHRTNGPAFIDAHDALYEYYLNDIQYSLKDYLLQVSKHYPTDFPQLFLQFLAGTLPE